MSCSGFPECKHTRNLDGEAPREKSEPELLDEKCPNCEKPLAKRNGRFGPFTACSDYPNCKYIQREKVELELLDEMCPSCKKPLAKRKGRYGPFVACSDYPTCKYIQKKAGVAKDVVIVKEKGCPDCKGNIVEKHTKKGKVFFGCDQYPKCKYAAWNKEDIK